MNAIVTDNLARIAPLREEHGVRQLDVFGSAARGELDERVLWAPLTEDIPPTFEALMGLVISGFAIGRIELGEIFQGAAGNENYFNHPSYLVSLLVIGFITWLLVKVPLANAGDPNEPAPPAAMM